MALYNFVECKPEEYQVKNGVLKYTGTETAIIIPDDVTTIKKTSIKSRKTKAIRIGKNVTTIETNTFEWFEVDDENSTYSSQDGVLFNKEQTAIIFYPSMNSRETYTIPKTVTSLGFAAFGKSKLHEVITHDGIESVGGCCFEETSNLSSFKWPVNSTEIKYATFRKSGITTISIPEGVKSLKGGSVFRESNLESISLPDSIEELGQETFCDCVHLSSVILPDTIKVFPHACFWGCKALKNISFPSSLERIEKYAIDSTGIKASSIPASVTIEDDTVKRLIEIEKDLKRIDERITEMKETGVADYQINATRLIRKRDENKEKLNNLFAARNYTAYNRLLLEVNEISKDPICTYNYCGKNIKLYPRNKVDGSYAIEVNGIIYVINAFIHEMRNIVTNFGTDASELDKAVMTGIAAGSFLGYFATKNAQVYNFINSSFSIYDSKAGTQIVHVSFGDNYKINSSQFNEISSAMIRFATELDKCVTEDITNDEMATAGYINSDTEQIRANIESRKNRLAEKERKEQEDAKQRFIDYWASHSEEKKRLQSEKSELGEKIQSMKASLQNQITDLNNQLNKSPLITELSKLEERIAMLTIAKSSLGIFKGKQKKEIQGQIDQANIEKHEVQRKIDSEKRAIEGRITTLQNQTANSIRELEARINAIDKELTKGR